MGIHDHHMSKKFTDNSFYININIYKYILSYWIEIYMILFEK